jgi:hypothetical protein
MTSSKMICHNEGRCLFSNADTALTVWGYVPLNELWLYETRGTLALLLWPYISVHSVGYRFWRRPQNPSA